VVDVRRLCHQMVKHQVLMVCDMEMMNHLDEMMLVHQSLDVDY
jgi:hypothetical protein